MSGAKPPTVTGSAKDIIAYYVISCKRLTEEDAKEAPNGMGDFASLDPQDQTSCGSALWLKAASWKAAISHSTSGVAEYQSLPCVKGGGVRKDTGGIVPGIDLICKAGDYSGII